MLLLTAVLAAAPRVATAQDTGRGIPRVEDAELIFEQGLEAFEAGDYGMSYRRFRFVYRDYPFNRKTTAAILMAGKSLYRDGEYRRADDLLTELIETFPESSYLDAAERTRGFARQQQEGPDAEAEPVRLGVALPLRDEDAALTQAFFNGVRLAIEERNSADARPVRMIFRNTANNPDTARRAVRELAREGADMIVGPLYSREAAAAGIAAEEEGVVMLAPLATEEEVASGRRYVFQANPTPTMRGRLMADFAINSLLMDELGVVGQYGNSISERMAEAFQREALDQEASVLFYELLERSRAWTTLADAVGTDTLGRVEAVYMPISGQDAPTSIRGALEGLDRARANMRILGNTEWHDRAIEQQASKYLVTYSNDFYLDEASPAVQRFIEQYRAQYGETPDQLSRTAERLAYTGYDVATYLLERSDEAEGRPLREVLRAAPAYQGLGIRIDFREGNVNQAMYYHRYRNGRVDLLR